MILLCLPAMSTEHILFKVKCEACSMQHGQARRLFNNISAKTRAMQIKAIKSNQIKSIEQNCQRCHIIVYFFVSPCHPYLYISQTLQNLYSSSVLIARFYSWCRSSFAHIDSVLLDRSCSFTRGEFIPYEHANHIYVKYSTINFLFAVVIVAGCHLS